jgi:hypothetical protein
MSFACEEIVDAFGNSNFTTSIDTKSCICSGDKNVYSKDEIDLENVPLCRNNKNNIDDSGFNSSISNAEIRLQDAIKKKQKLMKQYKDIYNMILKKIDYHVIILKDMNDLIIKNKKQDIINKEKLSKYNELNENIKQKTIDLNYFNEEYSDKQQIVNNMKNLLKNI